MNMGGTVMVQGRGCGAIMPSKQKENESTPWVNRKADSRNGLARAKVATGLTSQRPKKEGGGFEKCGRSSASDSDRGYPKCVPADKAASMSKKQIASAVRRKRSKKQGVGGKPTNVATFAKDGGEIMKSKMGTKGGAMGGKKKDDDARRHEERRVSHESQRYG